MMSLPCLLLSLLTLLPPAGGWLGILLADTKNCQVAEVVPDSPAQKAGLQPGDVILRINDQAVPTPEALQRAFVGLQVRQRITLQVSRAGEAKLLSLSAVLTERPTARLPEIPAVVEPKPVPSSMHFQRLGLELQVRDKVLRVSSVSPTSLAARAGIRSGDRLTHLGTRPLLSLQDLQRGLATIQPGQDIALWRSRAGETQLCTIKEAVGNSPTVVKPVVKPAGKPAGKPVESSKAKDALPHLFTANLPVALAKAEQKKQPLFMVFASPQSSPCRLLASSLQQGALPATLAQYQCLWLDVATESAMADLYHVRQLPHMLVLDSGGLLRQQVVGNQSGEMLQAMLTAGLQPVQASQRPGLSKQGMQEVQTTLQDLQSKLQQLRREMQIQQSR